MIRHARLAVAAALMLASATLPAQTTCTYPRAPASLPDGNTATLEEMVAGQKNVKQYMADMDTYLNCIDAASPPAPAADAQVSDEQKKEAEKLEQIRVQKHNAAVTDMEVVAERFNNSLRAFKAKQPKK